MEDKTEDVRRKMVEIVNAEGIPADYTGQVWDTERLQQEFVVEGFQAPFVVVKRKTDGQRGTLMFTHSPRVYFDFMEATR